ncbi:hypothetical protein [Pontibacillus marinus]|uniref:ABM domain-containing protein n=1 Tax=Pontibacillus marinus BH030004 = DSM 16465 TaxID=1385511 RepID=A0A0A5FXS0_9BACI|nr:hypothetical protein [Pontibacillus marinus]KGX85616.1 hypothetical protein N783_14070 [Pontibacillus marinus BH030004 = DSM 16465]
MSYVLLYFYKIEPEKVERFFEIFKQTKEKYIEYGGEAEEVFKLEEPDKSYGLHTLDKELNLGTHEELWLGLVRFNSEEHAKEVMEKFDRDEKVNELYNEFISSVTPLNKITFGEFKKHSY